MDALFRVAVVHVVNRRIQRLFNAGRFRFALRLFLRFNDGRHPPRLDALGIRLFRKRLRLFDARPDALNVDVVHRLRRIQVRRHRPERCFTEAVRGRHVLRIDEEGLLKQRLRAGVLLVLQIVLTLRDQVAQPLHTKLFHRERRLRAVALHLDHLRVERLEHRRLRGILPPCGHLELRLAAGLVDRGILMSRLQRQRPVELAQRFREQVLPVETHPLAKRLLHRRQVRVLLRCRRSGERSAIHSRRRRRSIGRLYRRHFDRQLRRSLF